MENEYAVVKICADGVDPDVYTFGNKEKARDFLKDLWAKTNADLREVFGNPIESETWCDSEGDYARITFEEDDWIYYRVVEVKGENEDE